MENLFNSMCSSLMAKENREKFLKGEGIQVIFTISIRINFMI